MIACVCWTPFQILNAINYKLSYKTTSEMDVYICIKFRDSEKIAKKLSDIGLFHQIYLVKNLNYDDLKPFTKKIKILKDLMIPQKAILQCLDKNYTLSEKKYSIIISAGYLNFNIYFSRWFQKRGAEIYFFEDGIESYLEKNTADNYSGIYRLMSELTKNGGTSLDINELYVYRPDLIADPGKYEKIFPLPSLNRIPLNVKEDLNKVFGYEKKLLSAKVIYFDQIGTGDFADGNLMFSIQNSILHELNNKFGENNIQIKLHPRTQDKVYSHSVRTFKTAVPWELIIMNESINNRILVSLSSTACLTPKLIFDEEPVVIFLFKLFPLKGYENVADLIFKVKELYREPNKICIPQNIEELDGMLEQILKRDNKDEEN